MSNTALRLIDQLTEWASDHTGWLSATALLSLAMLVATPVLLPAWVASLPADYFVAPRSRPRGLRQWLRRLSAWGLGAVLIVAGVLMLFLPGQGLLTLFAGLSLVPFPGKRNLMRRILTRPNVARGLQWMRRRARRSQLQLPDAGVAEVDPTDRH